MSRMFADTGSNPATVEELQRLIRLVMPPSPADAGSGERQGRPPELDIVDTGAMLRMGAERQPLLLAPVLPNAGLMLVHGPRGVGRSHVLVGCAAALAAGDRFLGWKAQRATDVLFISGAAPAALLGARLGAALRAMQGREGVGERLRLLAPDRQKAMMPALDTAIGQRQLVPLLVGCDVVVIDDAACLLPGMASNGPRSRARFSEFLQCLRHTGRTVIVGQASGLATHRAAERSTLACLEDYADVVVGLRRPPGYATGDGARFELHIERASHLPGAAREAREVRLEPGSDRQVMWTAARADELARDRLQALLAEGMPAAEAARELGISRTTAWRWMRQIAAARDAAGNPAELAAAEAPASACVHEGQALRVTGEIAA